MCMYACVEVLNPVYTEKNWAREGKRKPCAVPESALCNMGGEECGIWPKFGEGADVHYLEKWNIISFSVFLNLAASFFPVYN